jgi:hypothetical protein
MAQEWPLTQVRSCEWEDGPIIVKAPISTRNDSLKEQLKGKGPQADQHKRY